MTIAEKVRCEVCGQFCGPLNGRAKSWKCAGILAHRSKTGLSQQLRDDLRSRFSSGPKQQSRDIIGKDVLALPPAATVLDLYGGGLSAEWILSLRDDLDLTVADKDRRLWPALRDDAARLGFHAHCGPIDTIEDQRFDLIWLDLCSEPVTAFSVIRGAVHMLWDIPRTELFLGSQVRPSTRPSVMYVTVMNQDRNGRPELKPEIRRIAVQAVLDAASGGLFRTGMAYTARHLLDYPQAGHRGTASLWRLGPSYVEQQLAIRESLVMSKEGRMWHEDMAAIAFQVEAGERSGADRKCWPHAEGTCRCVERGYIDVEERVTTGARFRKLLKARRATR